MKKYYFLIIICGMFASCKQQADKLPIYGRRIPVEKLVNGSKVVDTVYQTIPSFKFLNQDSVLISNHSFDGKIYVADFFFTSCPSICPIMHRNLTVVYKRFKNNNQVMFLSHSIDYKYDYPYVLKKYADKLGLTGTKWQFVHGSKDSIYSLAKNNYLVSVGEDGRAAGGYVHQGYLVLVDKQKRVRGAYDGTKSEEVDKLMNDMDTLLKEENTLNGN